MATAEQIAAMKAEQEQEGIARVPVTETGDRVPDQHVEPLSDVSDPPAVPPPAGGEGGGEQPEPERSKPINMSPSDEMRANIARRFRRDDDGRVPFNGDLNNPEMQYGKFGRPPEETPPQTQQVPGEPQESKPQPRMITQKVRGVDITKSEEEWLADAAKVNAADAYLDEGRRLLENAKSLNRDTRERDPAAPHRPEARSNTQDGLSAPDAGASPQHPEDELEAAIEEVRYGTDSKEAANKLRTVLVKEADQAADARQIQRLVGQDGAKSAAALNAFSESNPDIANDEIACSIMEQQLYQIQRDELIKAGVDESQLPKDNRTLSQWHQFQRIHGSPVSSQEQLLEKAKERLNEWRGGSRQPQPDPRKASTAPRLEVNVDRNTRRMQLPNQPTRSAAPPPKPQSQPSTQADRSSIIANMRKQRGQIVA